MKADLPWRANLVGVSFPGVDEAEVSVWVRARGRERWGPWVELDAHGEHSPDGSEALRAARSMGTDPVWVSDARSVQVRLTGEDTAAIRDVRIHALNTSGDAYEVSLPVRAWRSVWRFLNRQPAEAEAAASKPRIISRSQWGGPTSKPKGFAGYAPEVKMVFVHHTDSPNSYTKSRAAAYVRGVHGYHTRSRGYSDIGYNFLVDRYGQVFEGRWGGIESAVIGAHTKGFNYASTGIALLGTYGSFTPPTAAQTSLKRLVAWKMDVHHAPIVGTVTMTSAGNERYRKGAVVRFNRVSGHRNAKPTACPGNRAYNLLPSFRSGANAIGHPKIILPTVSTTTVRPDADGLDDSTRFRASFTRDVAWTLRISGPATRTFAGTGRAISVAWAGTDAAGALLPTGRYAWRLDAQIPGGAVARRAIGTIYVVTDHPSGTLLSDGNGSYVTGPQTHAVANGVTRPSNFGTLPAVKTGPGERTRTIADPLGLALREGTLLAGEDDSRYIYSGGTLRRFVSTEIFDGLGYRSDAMLRVSASTLATYPAGAPVEDTTRHPDGTAIVDPNGNRWVIDAAELRPVGAGALRSRYRSAEIVPAVPGDLTLPIALGRPVLPRDGSLFSAPDGGVPYVFAEGALRRFRDTMLFTRMGFRDSMLLPIDEDELAALNPGPVLG